MELAYVRERADIPRGAEGWLEDAVRLELAFRAQAEDYDADDAIDWVLEQLMALRHIEEDLSGMAAALIDEVQLWLDAYEQEAKNGI